MSINKAMRSAQRSVPECLAIGCIDMSTGRLIGIESTSTHPRNDMDRLASTTAILFRDESNPAGEDHPSRRVLDERIRRPFQEIVLYSDSLLHILLRGDRYPSRAICFICRGSTNIAMALSMARLALPSIEAAA